MRLGRILVGTDFSPAAAAAARAALELAELEGATVTLCHVIELPRHSFLYPGALALEAAAFEAALAAERTPLLAAAAEALARRGHGRVAVATRLVGGRAAPALVRVARDGGFDLIVVGTHGRGALARALVGSVAAEVMRAAACPVMTVHAPDELAAQP